MKSILKVFAVAIILASSNSINAQEFKGVATYKTLTKLGVNLDSTSLGDKKKAASSGISISSEMREQIMEQLKKGSQQTYKLSFDRQQSIYKKEEKLAKPQPNSGGVSISFSFNGSAGDILYKNTKEKRYTSSNETYGKLFLIQDELQEHDWKLENETKNIGDYTCYKATKTYTRTQRISSFTSFSTNDKKKDKEEKKEEPQTKEVTVTVTAWYTPQIPVSTGPGIYHGLPGLILEVNDGRTTTVCSKIEVNPKDGFEIKEPKKGKKVNQKEFDEIVRKKSEEQMEQFRSRGRNGEAVQMIRIGG